MKHVFIIKDLEATPDSAKHILDAQINVILKAKEDLDITGIAVFYNGENLEEYKKEYNESISIKFIPVLKSKKKIQNKLSYAAFHNFVINSINPYLSMDDMIIHIIEGTLDITDFHAEASNHKTRLGETVTDIVNMMKLLDYPIWFNTASDKGNYKFGHYYTNLDLINIDEEHKLEAFPDCIMYSGNTNLDWIIIDSTEYSKRDMPNLLMNSKYDYDFLSIKEFIAKFANYGNGYFATMFPTVPTEVGAYARNPLFDKDLKDYDMTKYSDNMKLYKSNLKKYENLKQSNLGMVISYVKNTVINKLTDNDRLTLVNFSESL